jgi:hypothetical protein
MFPFPCLRPVSGFPRKSKKPFRSTFVSTHGCFLLLWNSVVLELVMKGYALLHDLMPKNTSSNSWTEVHTPTDVLT